MKKVLNIILCICILFGTLNVNVIAAEYNTEDVLCSAFVVMKGKRECLVKNYCAELSLLPIEENGRIYIGV